MMHADRHRVSSLATTYK